MKKGRKLVSRTSAFIILLLSVVAGGVLVVGNYVDNLPIIGNFSPLAPYLNMFNDGFSFNAIGDVFKSTYWVTNLLLGGTIFAVLTIFASFFSFLVGKRLSTNLLSFLMAVGLCGYVAVQIFVKNIAFDAINYRIYISAGCAFVAFIISVFFLNKNVR